MQRMSLSCGSVPTEYFMSKRTAPRSLIVVGDAAGDGFRRTEVQRAAVDFLLEGRFCRRRPAALGADAIARRFVVRPELFARLGVGVGDVAMRVDADGLYGLAELRKGAMVKVDKGPKPLGVAADDGEHQRQIVMRGAHHQFRRTADADPGA